MKIELDEKEIRYLTSAIRNTIIEFGEEERKAFKQKKTNLVETFKEYIKEYRQLENKLERIYRKWCDENGEIPF